VVIARLIKKRCDTICNLALESDVLLTNAVLKKLDDEEESERNDKSRPTTKEGMGPRLQAGQSGDTQGLSDVAEGDFPKKRRRTGGGRAILTKPK